MHHPTFDLAHWQRIFPIESFERSSGPRRFSTSKPDDPIDLWKAHGPIVSSPSDVACLEHIRHAAARSGQLGAPTPADLFVWAVSEPAAPYLTRIGGVPWRSRARPWPRAEDGTPMTFFAQLCFQDSRDIVPRDLRGDTMLVFMTNPAEFWGDEASMHIEWSDANLRDPMTTADVPDGQSRLFGFALAGVRHRTNDYPDDLARFERRGHYQPWLFATSQATKIGRAAMFIQDDPRADGEELLCVINSLQPRPHWPFIDLKREPDFDPSRPYHCSKYEIMFGDMGCLYFLIDGRGRVRCQMDCY